MAEALAHSFWSKKRVAFCRIEGDGVAAGREVAHIRSMATESMAPRREENVLTIDFKI